MKQAALTFDSRGELSHLGQRNHGMARLVAAVQKLSLARDLESIMAIVREAAREMTGADGATFVLRDGDQCHYAEENAIGPLWKGQRFPMNICISGWAMLHRQPAVIEDIYADSRIPADAYRPTFVKSMAMVPIRTEAPIGAIGNYWARPHRPTAEEVELLQALANTTSVAMENVRVYSELEDRVQERTAQLEEANRELEAFGHTVSHDLRAPLRVIAGYSAMLQEEHAATLPSEARDLCAHIVRHAERMTALIDGLLNFSHIARRSMTRQPIAMAPLVREVQKELELACLERTLDFRVGALPDCLADPILLRQVLVNLLGNAVKFTRDQPDARVEVGARTERGQTVYFVRDNGAGFDMKYVSKLFGVFQRLHRQDDFTGTGVGLSIVQRIIQRHGGRIWAEGTPGQGATFYFTIGEAADSPHLTPPSP